MNRRERAEEKELLRRIAAFLQRTEKYVREDRRYYDRDGEHAGFSKEGSPGERNHYDGKGRYTGYSKRMVKYYDLDGRVKGEIMIP